MRKTWLITQETYRRGLRSSSFLILTFGLPVLMVLAGAIPFIMSDADALPVVGFVDQTGDLAPPAEVPLDGDSLQVQTFEDIEAARAANRRGAIAGFLVVPKGYLEGEPAVFYGEESPDTTTQEALSEFLRRSLLPGQPDWLYSRLADPSQQVYVALEGGQEVAEGPALILHLAAPIGLGMFFALAVLMGSSQLGAAVVREKEQRSMEMIATSVRIRELVAGKVLGVSLLTLTQFAIWGAGAAIGIGLALTSLTDLQGLVVPWQAIVWALLLGVPGYLLYGTLAAGLGVIAGGNQQARQLAGFLGFVALVPFWFAGAVVTAPDGPLAIAASLFPLTSPTFSLMRMTFTAVPTWQLVTGLVLILLSLAAALWVVARIFRAAMLTYGQPLRPQQILRALRQA